MNKQEFLEQLRQALRKLSETEAEKSIMFYDEMISDRTEEGEDEERVVASLGDPKVVAATIIEELPAIPKAIAKSKTKSSTLNWVLAIAGAPLWVPLVICFAAALFCIYLSIWLVIISIWLCAICFLACVPIGLFGSFYCLLNGELWPGLWLLGCALAGGGLGIFFLYGALKTTAWLFNLSRRFVQKIASLFRKEQKDES